MSGQLGVIAPGAYVDILAVDGEPLKDVAALGKVSFAMKNGTVYTGAADSGRRP